MNYLKHYDTLISRAKSRTLTNGFETHHIIPKCAGGDNSKDNLVRLLIEEHYTAHLLLVKIYKTKDIAIYQKLLYACNRMTGGSNIGRKNKLYGWVKRNIRDARLGSKHSADTINKISEKVQAFFETHDSHLKGSKLTEDHKKKCSAALKGRAFTDEHKKKIGDAHRGKPKSDEHRAKFAGKNNPAYITVPAGICQAIMNDYASGVRVLELCRRYNFCETKILSILEEAGIDTHNRTCPHCGKTGQTSNMIRWHFDNCKRKI